ncbi:MAG TPA: ATP-binding protein [Burkholderiaceae bacterium]
MKLLTKCILLVAVPGLFQLLLWAAVMRSQEQAMIAADWTLHTKDVIAESAQLHSDVATQAASLRDAPAGSAGLATLADARIARLRLLVADNPLQLQRLDELARRMASLRTLLAQGGTVSQALAPFRSTLDGFVADEVRLDAQRTAALNQRRNRNGLLTVFALCASVLAAAAAIHLFRRGVGAQLEVLAENARRLAEGKPLAPQMASRDELAALDRIMHETGTRLSESEYAAQQYRQELERRSRELASVNSILRRQRQDNEMFIYSVSHDLRAPLVNLQGFSREIAHACDELKQTLDASPSCAQQRSAYTRIIDDDMAVSLKYMQTAVSRTAAIIDALLRLSRAGQVRITPQLIPTTAVIERIVDSMQAQVAARGATISILPLPDLWVDPVAADQIFANLIGNALAYLDSARPGQIEIGALPARDARTDGWRTLYVKDNGLGIPKEHMSKLFTPFQRLHSNVAKGEGIGLALVQRAVERHGGRIWAEAIGGHGALFLVTLPLAPPQDISI